MHLSPTAGFQNINFDIWKQIVEGGGGLYKYPIKNISKTAKLLPILIKLKVLPGSWTESAYVG